MKKNIFSFFTLLMIIVLFTFSCANAVDSYLPSTTIGPGINGGDGTAEAIAVKIIGSLMWAGFVIAIGMIIFIGIKYVMASADERASMKGMLVKIIIGSLIIAGSTAIVNAVISITDNRFLINLTLIFYYIYCA